MNILKIKFQNINSLKGDHEIDFSVEPLRNAGLFAITGATGSGKSTILDVITLALYGRIPRISEKITKTTIETTGLILTRNMSEASAQVTYSCKEGVFTSGWSISKNRNGKLRDYDMQISNEAGRLLDVRKSEVSNKNEQLVGLSFEQFVKAIILAQGDFAAFLKAKKDERSGLLEQITGSYIYRELGKAAFEKNKEKGAELERLSDLHESRKLQLLDEDLYKELVANIENLSLTIAANNKTVATLKEQETLKKEIAELAEKINQTHQTHGVAQSDLTNFQNEHGPKMLKHRELIPHQSKLWEWKQLSETLTEQEAQQKKLAENLEQCSSEDVALRKEIAELTKSDLPVMEALAAFRAVVLNVKNELNQSLALHQTNLVDVKQGAKALNIIVADKPDVFLNQVNQLISENRDFITNSVLSENIKANPTESLTLLSQIRNDINDFCSETKIIAAEMPRIDELRKNILNLTDEISLLPEKIDKTVNALKFSELQLDNLEKEKTIRDLTASLDDHRQNLISGEPCPLCGSCTHPFAENIPPAKDDLNEKIKTAKNDKTGLQKELNTLEANHTSKKDELKRQEKQLTDAQANVKRIREKADQLLAGIPQEYYMENPADMQAHINGVVKATEAYKAALEKQEKLDALIGKSQRWNDLMLEVSRLNTQLTEIYKGEDIIRDTDNYQKRITGNNTRKQELTNNHLQISHALKTNKEKFDNLKETLKMQLPLYDSLADALNDLMDNAAYARLSETEGKYREIINNSLTALKIHDERMNLLKATDVETDIATIQLAKAELEETVSQQTDEKEALVGTKSVQDNLLTELQELEVKIGIQKKENEKWVLLSKYIGDATGKKFCAFAQELTMHQLIQMANKRLLRLSDRYLLSAPAENEDESLCIIDTHMGDVRRSVKTLSGGESFLISLSLALALSDMAARKVEIKSLFIDEGFGSLDKLTLDQTMDTLEKLQYESGKTIGVISHVEAMQERITTQIKLEKTGQGYSRLVVE